MNPWPGRLLWAGAIVATVACAWWLSGCAAPKEAAAPTVDLALAVACSDVMNRAVAESPTCKQAERKINESAVCRELKPEGFTLRCKEGT